MTEIRNYDSAQEVADAAAENAIEILRQAIELNGRASWVLAGGTSPMLAYRKVVESYAEDIDWSCVTLIIGDERMVFLDDKDSNWGTIISLFEAHPATARAIQLVPHIHKSPELTAADYEDQIRDAGIVRFDLVWLGVGEDGHTLSLFPDNEGYTAPADRLVIPIHHSPKPPSDRISLSMKAAEMIVELVIFAVGAAKKDILGRVRLNGDVPVAVFAQTAENHGAEVRWLYDNDAWGE